MSGDFGKWLVIAGVALVVMYAVFHVATLKARHRRVRHTA